MTVCDIETSAAWYQRVFRAQRLPMMFPHYEREDTGYGVLLLEPGSGLAIGLTAMAGCAAAFLLVPGVLAGLFTDEVPVIVATVPLLQIAALFQLSDGTQAIAAGALRGLGDNRTTFIGNLIGHYAIGLVITIVLTFGAHMGAPGLWWGLSAGLTATAVFLVLRFHARTRMPA